MHEVKVTVFQGGLGGFLRSILIVVHGICDIYISHPKRLLTHLLALSFGVLVWVEDQGGFP